MNIGTRENLSVLRFRKGGSTQYFTSGLLALALSSVIMTANRLYAIPFFVAKTEKFDRIAVEVTGATAGNKARLGIYADDGTSVPGRLVLDAGEVEIETVTVVQIIISQELFGGQLYWLAMVCSGTNVSLNTLALGTLYSLFYGLSSTLGTAWGVSVFKAFTYAALPDPFGTPTIQTASGVPAIFLRKV